MRSEWSWYKLSGRGFLNVAYIWECWELGLAIGVKPLSISLEIGPVHIYASWRW